MNRHLLIGLVVVALLAMAGVITQASIGSTEMRTRLGAEKTHPLRYDLALINRWGLSSRPSTYAGTYYSPRRGGVLIVGFTDDRNGSMSEVRSLPGILEPDRLMPRRRPAHYSLRFLRHLEARLLHEVVQPPGYGHLVISWRINLQGNLLRVTSGRVRRAKKVLKAKFGSGAPIVVRYGERATLA